MAKKLKQELTLEELNITDNEVIDVRTSDDFINTEVKEYAHYVIKNRSTLHLMDGLRTGARKIIYGGINNTFKGAKRNNLVKYNNLFSGAFENAYEHGDSSLKSTIEQFSSKHVLKIAPFFTEGQIPKLRIDDVNVASRYLEVTPTKYLDLFTKDLDLCTLNFEENKFVEPKFMLPIIPIPLIYRTSSPGFGYGYSGFSYNLYDIISAIISTLKYGTCQGFYNVNMKPDIYGIDPNNIIYNSSKDMWFNIGEYEIKGDIVYIKDLPYTQTKKSYATYLTKLVEKGEIKSYFDNSKTSINFEIEFHPNQLKVLYNNKGNFYNKLRLIKTIPKNNYNLIDINDKVIEFDSPNELLETFVSRRLVYFEKKRIKLIDEIKSEIKFLTDMIDFINAVIDGTLIIFKRSRKDVVSDIEKLKLNKDGLELRTSKFTSDGIADIQSEIDKLTIDLNTYLNTTDKEMYLNDIIDLMHDFFRVDDVDSKLNITKNLTEFDDDGVNEPIEIDTKKKRKPRAKKS